ncbi:MAG: hypothetical protein UT08_C0022G0012 [Candidatus Woesebacteria bacterium GW2011_GWB1_38_8]|uniref:Uncharacterized protein n=1 Tax=Candidatus Woesebacteria bacterium GW2011_GWB1_38_8 TaxID=1618570 RepID=A0A0G0L8K4_9BACT|nr:MAG: hypothetical protein UT08_C0022G0012 [Candidatus Woesebacteria bacterium GW2011_GWB1_38_8]
MKLPKLKKSGRLSLNIKLGKGYIINLPDDSSLIKNIPKLVDIVMDKNNSFEDKNKLQIELQHLSDLILQLEFNKKKL